jgi:hypothetical protein
MGGLYSSASSAQPGGVKYQVDIVGREQTGLLEKWQILKD